MVSSYRLCIPSYGSKLARSNAGNRIKPLTAKNAQYDFGRLIDVGCTEFVALAKRRPFVVVMETEEYERLKDPATATRKG